MSDHFNNNNLPSIICILGPTAAGKSQLAVELTQILPVEIISVDSAMVYYGMDIGTAKPSKAEREQIPHHLIDICDPKEIYSAGQFREDALYQIEKIIRAKKIPLLVGGTMLYFHVLQQGLSDLPKADAVARTNIQAQAREVGWKKLHERLQTLDPKTAARIHPNDAQRISRALEIYELTGKSLTEIAAQQLESIPQFNFINIAIAPSDRNLLHTRIAQRFQSMLEAGLIEEVEKLFRREDLHADLPAIKTVGYRQVWDYLAGRSDSKTMQEKAIAATRQLAKRQLTWLRGWEDLHLFDSEDSQLRNKLSQFIMKKLSL